MQRDFKIAFISIEESIPTPQELNEALSFIGINTFFNWATQGTTEHATIKNHVTDFQCSFQNDTSTSDIETILESEEVTHYVALQDEPSTVWNSNLDELIDICATATFIKSLAEDGLEPKGYQEGYYFYPEHEAIHLIEMVESDNDVKFTTTKAPTIRIHAKWL